MQADFFVWPQREAERGSNPAQPRVDVVSSPLALWGTTSL